MSKETRNKKRKAEDENTQVVKTKKQKIKNDSKPIVKLDSLPKNSKKNKYFFMAHPEMLKDKETISKGTEFVIDEEKMKAENPWLITETDEKIKKLTKGS